MNGTSKKYFKFTSRDPYPCFEPRTTSRSYVSRVGKRSDTVENAYQPVLDLIPLRSSTDPIGLSFRGNLLRGIHGTNGEEPESSRRLRNSLVPTS